MKIKLFFTFICLFLTASFAFAQGAPGGSAPAKASAQKTCPPYDDAKMKADATQIADAIDKNKDGRMTQEEWLAAGAPENSFKYFMAKDKDKKGYVTREVYLAETPPDGLDANCDGKLTLKEFQDFDRKNSAGSTPAAASPSGGVSTKK
jgi:hypothetical protein